MIWPDDLISYQTWSISKLISDTKKKHCDQLPRLLDWKCGLKSLQKILRLTHWPSFLSNWDQMGPVLISETSFMNKLCRRFYIRNITALCLPVSDKKNIKVSFFVHMFKLVTTLRSGPKGIIWTNLVEVHSKVLHTKYCHQQFLLFPQNFLSWHFHQIWNCRMVTL